MTIYRAIRTSVPMIIMLMLGSCTPSYEAEHLRTRVDNVLDDVDRDRNAVRVELMDLRKDIDNKVIAIEEEMKIEDLEAAQREEKEQVLLELQENRHRVQQALIEIERSSESSWMEVRTRSKNLTRSVDKWFERQAERQDLRG